MDTPDGDVRLAAERTWRPVQREDVPAMTELMAAVETVDRTDEHYDQDDVVEHFLSGLSTRSRHSAGLGGRRADCLRLGSRPTAGRPNATRRNGRGTSPAPEPSARTCRYSPLDQNSPASIAGYLLAYVYEADVLANGRREVYVGQLGTLPAFRGRGVGSALMATGLANWAAAGHEEAFLGVDAANETGALGLCERAGYRIHRRQTSWGRSVPAQMAGQAGDTEPASRLKPPTRQWQNCPADPGRTSDAMALRSLAWTTRGS